MSENRPDSNPSDGHQWASRRRLHVLVVPAVFVGQQLVVEAVKGADTITARVESADWQHVLDGYPAVAPITRRITRQIDLPGAISTVAAWVTNAVAAFVRGSVVQAIDLLYPILVGNRMKLHTVPAFMAIVGGVFVFGASGLILGPVTLTVTLSLLEAWRARSS